ncbi:MAG: serine hydrolase [Microcystis sp.]|uniref:serine hydrolase n=1 Tax=Microcystis sp. TaxID=1127 RepID=UPI00391A2186
MERKRIKSIKVRTQSKTYHIQWSRFLPILISFFVTSAIALYLILNSSKNESCRITKLLLINGVPKSIGGKVDHNKTLCYEFQGIQGQQLQLTTNQKISLVFPSNKYQNLQGDYKTILSETGDYSLVIETQEDNLDYQINLIVSSQNTTNLPRKTPVNDFSLTPLTPQLPSQSNQLTYNVKQSPTFYQDQELQKIVDNIVSLARSRKLPIDKLSISLVDLNQSECCAYAAYQDSELRYPASIVKLFWLVVLYSQYYYQGIEPNQIPPEKLKVISKMIKDSDNESASIIVDDITQTKSSQKDLAPEKLNEWRRKRYALNDFFASYFVDSVNYPLNISQKTFPIPNLLEDPAGPDQQIRQLNGKSSPPRRNYLNTYSVARLLLEIEQEQAISPAYSQAIKQLIKRDLHPQAWKEKPFNPIQNFLGQSLPVNTQFYAKMGWTFNNRNDAAIIVSPDNKAHYILVVFGEEKKFYQDKEFFPILSRQVYNQMLKK